MERLKELRKQRNITMKELGSKLNLAESTISLYESGKREADYQTLKRLSEFFNVSIDYLLGKANIDGIKFNRDVIKVPIYGEIPAGIPIEMIEDSFIEDYEEIDAALARGDKVFFG